MFYGLLNSRISWKRKINSGTNTFGEAMFLEQLIASAVACNRQVGAGYNAKQLIENKPEGGMNYKLSRYYLAFSDSNNIQEGDIINLMIGSDTYSDIGIVRDVADDAGQMHHRKLIVEEIKKVGEGNRVNV